MVVRESCPTALFWPKEDLQLQPSTQCKYLVKEVRNQSGKYCIQKFRKKISLSESSLSFQHTHLSRVAPILEQPPWRTAKQIYCVGEGREAWESQVLLCGHAGRYHGLGINSCPLHRSLWHALPGLPWHRPGPNQALSYPPCCRCLWVSLLNTSRRCLSQKHVYTLSIFRAFKHFIRSEIPTTASGDSQKVQSLVGKRDI